MNHSEPGRAPRVGVVVIGYNDAVHVTTAVRSALAQGPAVREVVAVDDCSTDHSVEALTRLAATEPRVTVVRRRVNSGGCGSPRNTGLDRVTSPYVMFLDSDDVLPPGAVDALLTAATGACAEVASGLCVRRELPGRREVPWQAPLYASHAVFERPAQRPRLVHDTLCVNKLYRTDFLREHGIRFPEGRFHYEDFVFTARVLAARPRIALVPDRVYIWHVRRSADRLSISLDRADIANWRARTEASRLAYDILLGAGQKELARAARAKFLDHEVRIYARELGLHDAHYQRAWWAHTRAYLAEYDASDWAHNPTAPGRLIGRVVLASPEPRDLPRLRDLAARPARLLPPYAHACDGTPSGRPTSPNPPWTPCSPAPSASSPSPSTRNCTLARAAPSSGSACTSCTAGWRRQGPRRWRWSGGAGRRGGRRGRVRGWRSRPRPRPTASGRPGRRSTGPRSPEYPGRTGRPARPAPGISACACASRAARIARSRRTPSRAPVRCADARWSELVTP